MDEDNDEIREEAKKLVVMDEDLKFAYQSNRISKAEFEERHNLILDRLDTLRRKETREEDERDGLLAKLLSLQSDLNDGIIDSDTYTERFTEIQEKLESLDHPGKQLRTQKNTSGDSYYYSNDKNYTIFSASLWVILILSILISVTGLFSVTDALSSALTHVPAQYKDALMSYQIAILVILIIGVLIRAVILWASASIAGIEKATYGKAIICTIAGFIAGVGSSVALYFISTTALIRGDSINSIVLITWTLPLLQLIILVFLDVWIIKSAFYTEWGKAILTEIIEFIIGIIITAVIYLALIVLFGFSFHM